MSNHLSFVRDFINACKECRRVDEKTTRQLIEKCPREHLRLQSNLVNREAARREIISEMQFRFDALKMVYNMMKEYEKPETARITEESYD